MAKKPQSFIPPKGPTFRPTVERQRQILEQVRDEMRDKGFLAEQNAESLAMQEGEDPEKQTQAVESYKKQAENCYKAARMYEAKLAQMPLPKKAAEPS